MRHDRDLQWRLALVDSYDKAMDVNPYESPQIGDAGGLIQIEQPPSDFDRWWLLGAYAWPLVMILLLPAAQIIAIPLKLVFIVISAACLLRLTRGMTFANFTFRLLAITIHLFIAFLVVMFPIAVPPGPPKPY